ncbi:MAG: hypothetical protein AAF329_28010, partial [Cyanobacteria bacterium P01_A01_bin.17]
GAIKNAGIRGDWPGLRPKDLRDGRDLRAVTDFRDLVAQVAERHLSISGTSATHQLFPEKQSDESKALYF